MHTGMMWFDNDSVTELPAKVRRAAAYYQNKYGVRPDTCLVNPAMLGGKAALQLDAEASKSGGAKSERITVRASRSVLPGHLWIGVQDKLPQAAD
jgi:hypothetical protein